MEDDNQSDNGKQLHLLLWTGELFRFAFEKESRAGEEMFVGDNNWSQMNVCVTSVESECNSMNLLGVYCL